MDIQPSSLGTAEITLAFEQCPIRQTILKAIQDRRKVTFLYDHDKTVRTFSPYYFRKTKDANFIMNGWQNINPNKPDDNDFRRTFRLEKIKSMTLLDEGFVPDEKFRVTPFETVGMIACISPWEKASGQGADDLDPLSDGGGHEFHDR